VMPTVLVLATLAAGHQSVGEATPRVRSEGRILAEVSWHGGVDLSSGAQHAPGDGDASRSEAQQHEPSASLPLHTGLNARYPIELFHCAKAAAETTKSLASAEYERIVARIGTLMQPIPELCGAETCSAASFQGCVIRLAAHDFLDFQDLGTLAIGGSDGCTDLYHPINAGLAQCIQEGGLPEIYREFCETISLADFLVIAAEAVMHHARSRLTRSELLHSQPQQSDAFDFQRRFRYGRTTAKSCAVSKVLPRVSGAGKAMEDCFINRLGLTWAEAAALMGGHVAGRALHLGPKGWWSGPSHANAFDNYYFVAMLMHGWRSDSKVEGLWLRSDTANEEQVMLSTDLSLAYGIASNNTQCCAWTEEEAVSQLMEKRGFQYCSMPSNDTAAVSRDEQKASCCDAGGFDNASTCEIIEEGQAEAAVRSYALFEESWLHTFSLTWTKVTNNGYPDLPLMMQSSASVHSSPVHAMLSLTLAGLLCIVPRKR